MPRETKKQIECMDRKFEIRSFDAFTGSYIAFTLLEKMLPMGMESKIKNMMVAEGKNVESMPLPDRAIMSKQEFINFQRDCLSVVSEVLPARSAPILNSNGSWGVPDMSDNTALVFLLTIHALVFNVAGFFTGNALQGLKALFKDLLPANTKTSIPGSTGR